MNKVILVGNLVDDPKISTTAGGIPKCTFRLATQQDWTNQQTGRREADFHTVVVWRQQAENCARYLSKGRLCAVEGTIQYRSYNAQDGSKRYVTEIVAERVRFLGGTRQQNGSRQAAADGYAAQDGFIPVDDEELPFG